MMAFIVCRTHSTHPTEHKSDGLLYNLELQFIISEQWTRSWLAPATLVAGWLPLQHHIMMHHHLSLIHSCYQFVRLHRLFIPFMGILCVCVVCGKIGQNWWPPHILCTMQWSNARRQEITHTFLHIIHKCNPFTSCRRRRCRLSVVCYAIYYYFLCIL